MIPDEDFIRDPDIPGPTKEEIRCLLICKSNVTAEDTVIDVGCGTGGLTVEFARRAEFVYAIDKNQEALKLTAKNLEKHDLQQKVKLIEANVLDALNNIPKFDILMIGGSSGDLPLIIKKGYRKLKTNGRILVTSILLETRVEAVKTMQDLDIIPEIVEVSISKGKIMDRGTMMLARNPVTIISGEK
jgi:cobalt-precorrin-6B (C15)-methyltransferase